MRTAIRESFAVTRPRNVGLVSMAHGLNEFYSIAIPPIIPLLVADLDITLGQAGLLLTVFFAMYSIFQLPAGVVADHLGKKEVLVGGMLCMAVGILLAGGAPSYEVLVLAQALAGIGGSTFHPAGLSLISDFETADTEGRAMGVFGFGGMVGVTGAPIIIGGVAALLGWRWALAAAAVVGIAITIAFLVLFRLPNTGDSDGRTGTGTDTVSDSTSGTGGDLEAIMASLRTQMRNAVTVHLTAGVLILFLLTVMTSMQVRAVQTFTTSFLFTYTDESTTLANFGFFAMLVAGSLSSLWAGSLADRVNRGLFGFVMSLVTASLLGLTILIAILGTMLGQFQFFAVMLAWFFVIGIAMYAGTPVKNAIVSSLSEREFSGSMFGVMQTGSAIGSATGPAIFGGLASWFGIQVAYPMIAVVSIFMGLCFLYFYIRP